MMVPTRCRHTCVVSAILVSIFSVPAWTLDNRIQEHLNSAYKGKSLLLRNFYIGDDLDYDKDGNLREGKDAPGPWTLAGVELTKIDVSANGVDVQGNRLGIVFKDDRQNFSKVGKIRIHISKPISNEDAETALDATFEKIFIKVGQEDLRSLVPAHWRSYLSGNDLKSRSSAFRASLEQLKIPTRRYEDLPTGQLTAPQPVYTPDPGYTKQALSRGVEGTSVLGVVVDSTGTPVEAAILKPLGMGLDEAAILAVSKWKFRPAAFRGEPAQVQITVEVSFRR